jgi:hypothetical protein
MFLNRKMAKQDVVCPYNRILLSNENEQTAGLNASLENYSE